MDRQQETELARAVLGGDAAAFDQFVELYRTKLFQYSYLMCGQREDAEEVSQETLLKVFENFDQLREPERMKAWVYRIARNACLMKRRRSVFAPRQELSLDELMPSGEWRDGERRLEIADWKSLPDEELLAHELQRTLREAIGELPDIYRSVVLLRDIEEMTTEEAAEILDLTTDTVKTRLHRGRLAIRKRLDEYLRTRERI
ncbi:MAG: sigma-70 family RNA polymerase sigma factor [Acidobacteria bacterium]|nr:sigma-70 family RNA polymerase sigma factor [Acidobacteriota bacterium]